MASLFAQAKRTLMMRKLQQTIALALPVLRQAASSGDRRLCDPHE